MYSCWVDHGVCQGCLHALFIIGRSVCRLLSDDVAIIADGVCVVPPPPFLFQRGMTGGKPTVPSSSLCLIIFHSFCGLNRCAWHQWCITTGLLLSGLMLTMLCWQVGNYSMTKRCYNSWIIIPVVLL